MQTFAIFNFRHPATVLASYVAQNKEAAFLKFCIAYHVRTDDPRYGAKDA